MEIRRARPGEKYLTLDVADPSAMCVHVARVETRYVWPVVIDQYEVTGCAYPGDPAFEVSA